jgi:outer membrane protein assembly factor BamA
MPQQPPATADSRPAPAMRPCFKFGLLALLIALAAVYCPARAADHGPQLFVEDILCRGNATTSCRFIRGYLYVRVGQVLDEDEIRYATLRLSWLQNFKSVDIHLEKGSQKGRVLVVIEVVEASPITAAFSLGAASRFGSRSQTLSADIGDRNLLGRGKSLDLILAEETAFSGNVARERLARLQYFDPQLLDSSRLFLTAGAYGFNTDYRYENGDRFNDEAYGLDAGLGLRFGHFSYVTVGYRYLPHSDVESVVRGADGVFQTERGSAHSLFLVGYGFNSEDDVYFPTRGSRLDLYMVGGTSNNGGFSPSGSNQKHSVGGEYRHVWRIGDDSFLVLHALDQPIREARASFDNGTALGLSYEHTLSGAGPFDGIRRGRWYVAPGATQGGYSGEGQQIREVGLRVGVIVETRSSGYLSLYVFGSGTVKTGGH